MLAVVGNAAAEVRFICEYSSCCLEQEVDVQRQVEYLVGN